MHHYRMVNILHFPEYLNQRFTVIAIRHEPVIQSHGAEQIMFALSTGSAQFFKPFIHASMYFGYGHLIIIEDDNHIGAHFAHRVEPFQRFAAAHGTIANHRNDIFMATLKVSGHSQAGSEGNGCGRMSYFKEIVFTFCRIGIAGYIVVMFLFQIRLFAPGENLVRIYLMGYIPYNLIFWRIKYGMKRNGGFHNAKIRAKMAAMDAGPLQHSLADFLRQFFSFRCAQCLKIFRSVYSIQYHIFLLYSRNRSVFAPMV